MIKHTLASLEPLLDLYATTVFLCSKPIIFNSFAIITGCNPNGQILTENENKKLNKLLELQIKQYPFVEVIGASADLTHQEPSFAVQMSLSDAQELANKHQQNAIFWVNNDLLSIEPAGLVFRPRAIGRFSTRCQG